MMPFENTYEANEYWRVALEARKAGPVGRVSSVLKTLGPSA